MYDVKSGKVLYIDGRFEEALEHFYTGAASGDAEAAFHYAYMHMKGIGTEQDYAVAKSFFTFALGQVAEAAYNLSVMYMHGLGVATDYKKSYEFMRDAAEGGVIEAQLYLGVAHTIGYMYEPDIVCISLLPYHTPEYRDPYSELSGYVPDMSEDEQKRIRAVRLDFVSAFEWFRESARHTSDYVEELSQKGKYLYARCFLDGVGTDYNRDKANSLMLLAAAQGSEDAYTYLTTEAPYVLTDPKNRDTVKAINDIQNQKFLSN